MPETHDLGICVLLCLAMQVLSKAWPGSAAVGVAFASLSLTMLLGCAHRDDAPMVSFEVDAAAEKYLRWHMVETRYFVTDARCGSGPFEIRLSNPPGKKGDSYFLYAYAPHGIQVRMSANFDNGTYRDSQHFGTGAPDNAACILSPEERARETAGGRVATAPVGPTAVNSGPTPGRSPGTGSEAAPAAPMLLREIPRPSAAPDGRQVLVSARQFQNAGWSYSSPITDVTYRFWSDEPNDWHGITFVVAHAIAEVVGSEHEFAKEEQAIIQAKSRADYLRSKDVPPQPVSPPSTFVSSDPPPAPRAEIAPPRPSAHATWIAGYWHWEDASWVWVGGRWRVPSEDVARDLTVHAPTPPPPPRAEAPPPPRTPMARLVWTPGYWQWDGRVYVWVLGSWQLAPQAGSVWAPDRWESRGGFSVFIPGGWLLRTRP